MALKMDWALPILRFLFGLPSTLPALATVQSALPVGVVVRRPLGGLPLVGRALVCATVRGRPDKGIGNFKRKLLGRESPFPSLRARTLPQEVRHDDDALCRRHVEDDLA